MVGEYRRHLSSEERCAAPTFRTAKRKGKEYQMDVSKIGRSGSAKRNRGTVAVTSAIARDASRTFHKPTPFVQYVTVVLPEKDPKAATEVLLARLDRPFVEAIYLNLKKLFTTGEKQ